MKPKAENNKPNIFDEIAKTLIFESRSVICEYVLQKHGGPLCGGMYIEEPIAYPEDRKADGVR